MHLPFDWIQPDWPAPGTVRALCTTRHTGASQEPFNSFNLGNHVGDAPAAVQANRAALHEVMGPHAAPVFLRQVHGVHVLALQPGMAHEQEADACYRQGPGVACTIMVADCLPVLLCDRAGTTVAAAHAGWRGLAAGVLEAALQAFPVPGEVLAWLGPCIGPQAFEVGAEVRAAFCARHADAAQCFQAAPGGKFRADLQGLARLRLRAAGVSAIYGNDASAPWCTVRNASRFFSHRRDSIALGGSGRMAACIWLDA